MFGEANWLDFKGDTYARMYHSVAKPEAVVELDTGLFAENTKCLEIEYRELEVRLRVRWWGGYAGHAWVWGQVSRCQGRPLVV